MKEICFIGKGETIDKISYLLNVPKDFEDQGRSVMGYNYATINNGNDDIMVVRNYNPCIIKNVEENETVLDIYASGFEIVGDCNYISNKVVLKKPSGIKYIVKPLERIGDIAKRFKISIQDIMNLNNLKTDKLFVGQILIL